MGHQGPREETAEPEVSIGKLLKKALELLPLIKQARKVIGK